MTTAARAAVGVVVAAAVLLGYFLVVPRDFYTGTNGTRTRGTLLEINGGAPHACFPGLEIPKGTGQIEYEVDTNGAPLPPLAFSLTTSRGVSRDRLPLATGGRQKIRFAFPKTARTMEGTACVRVADGGRSGGKVFFGGVPGTGLGQEPVRIEGVAQTARAAIWYRPPAADAKASLLFHLPTLFERVSRFRPGWTGPWLYWILFLLVAPALAWGALRLLLAPERRRRLPLAVAIGLIGFANAAVWAHVTPAFNTPDESEHFAYVQSLAERGDPPDAGPGPRTAYSGQESLALTATQALDNNETPDGKPLWTARAERRYEAADPDSQRRNDGGGYEAATSSHSPLFYSLAVPAYDLTRGGGLFAELTAIRLLSALLAGLVAACAFLIVRELAPSHPRFAVAAGVSVAFQPMFAFMGGSFNNDMGVNAAGAVVTLLLVRLLRRGFSPRLAIGLGVAVAVAPLMKLTGYAVYPGALLGVALAAYRFRRHRRQVLIGGLLVLAGIIVVSLGWGEISSHVGRSTFTTPDGKAPGSGAPAVTDPTATLTYVWQVFLPSLPGMNEHWTQSWPAFDIFGIRGWGAFGWYALTWSHHLVYWVIMVTLVALLVLGLTFALRRGREVRERVPETLILLALAGGTIGVMTAGYYSEQPQGALFPIQGRYVFPAITSLAALFVLSTQGAGRRLATPLVTGLATAVVCLGYASLWLVLGGFYFAA